jgi:hypothetical protein
VRGKREENPLGGLGVGGERRFAGIPADVELKALA